ncbi:hypothetical protein QE412_001635 [Microbacterium trichothecenolyticum]|uniref:Uncharacterized protein n=1 Tax=Microbacterium trichothecenolyticum TaxID=69370 RepID=A0ABU0TVV5_MICTR|nr:hypothetical protein [Microbacterium trichothecenolyticum]
MAVVSAAPRAFPRRGDAPVGRHKIAAACLFRVPAAETAPTIAAVTEGLRRSGFVRSEVSGEVIVMRRGSFFGDAVLNGTGLALVTSRLGPLSKHAVVLVDAVPVGEQSEIVVSMIVGHELSPIVADAVDPVVDDLAARGAIVQGPGWMRPVDLPRESLGHPSTAKERGYIG